jgi:rhomboid protease GluP
MLITLNTAIYIYTAFLSNSFITIAYNVTNVYGQDNQAVFSGSYWQLFTAMFVHADIAHLLGNMLFLLIFGLRAEELFSLREYFAIYFLSGLVGNLLTLLLGPKIVSVGASGAIFGLFGACAIYVRKSIGQSIMGALLYAFFLLMISSKPGVNVLAHFGGLAVGLLIGYGIAVARKRRIIYEYRYSIAV